MSDIEGPYLLIKRDLYWALNSQGYTGLKDRAQRYSAEQSASWIGEGVTRILEKEAPDFSDQCWIETKINSMEATIRQLQSEIENLEGPLTNTTAELLIVTAANSKMQSDLAAANTDCVRMREAKNRAETSFDHFKSMLAAARAANTSEFKRGQEVMREQAAKYLNMYDSVDVDLLVPAIRNLPIGE